jgi:hypothetical protein
LRFSRHAGNADVVRQELAAEKGLVVSLPTVERATAPLRRELVYSLIDLREILLGCNRRYLTHLSALDDFSAGVRALDRQHGEAYRAINPRRVVPTLKVSAVAE